ncbi:cytochrome b-c1 complex subunit 7-like [Agrilus planipennis]|uniref:Cytochrome b-c1 complex subunit 7 n=1 Tax=Agrilus planipennis TaxID=224129 RepID=A0A1W4XD97_AGRPL|nr:cytochrome b-c1 complex subunit 7-like [Agrilus planipennis]XP_025833398.1 cytochrome b-c1 complex subunit 7-like [Agrilus planipennis]XP_025833399.1 cytochrome b-c1 complex subunit 7-like [Agrilus planipennis]
MSLGFVQRRFMSSALQKFAYNLSGFHKYGLMRDDVLFENDDVKEALRRIPQKVIDERNYRMLRAMQLSLQKEILPKEQWTKLEEDKLYLTPIVEQVIKERNEREEWEKDH